MSPRKRKKCDGDDGNEKDHASGKPQESQEGKAAAAARGSKDALAKAGLKVPEGQEHEKKPLQQAKSKKKAAKQASLEVPADEPQQAKSKKAKAAKQASLEVPADEPQHAKSKKAKAAKQASLEVPAEEPQQAKSKKVKAAKQASLEVPAEEPQQAKSKKEAAKQASLEVPAEEPQQAKSKKEAAKQASLEVPAEEPQQATSKTAAAKAAKDNSKGQHEVKPKQQATPAKSAAKSKAKAKAKAAVIDDAQKATAAAEVRALCIGVTRARTCHCIGCHDLVCAVALAVQFYSAGLCHQHSLEFECTFCDLHFMVCHLRPSRKSEFRMAPEGLSKVVPSPGAKQRMILILLDCLISTRGNVRAPFTFVTWASDMFNFECHIFAQVCREVAPLESAMLLMLSKLSSAERHSLNESLSEDFHVVSLCSGSELQQFSCWVQSWINIGGQVS
jgi:hypothetical protein